MKPTASNRDRPNILLIMPDQQHAEAIHAFGNPHLQTPALDRLTREGCRLSNCYATEAICVPSRASFFYGRFPCETLMSPKKHAACSNLPTLGHQLGAAGYRSVYVGKWHIGPSMTMQVPGFDTLVSGINNNSATSDILVTRASEGFLRDAARRPDPFLLVAGFQQPHDICQWIPQHGPRIESLAARMPEDLLPPLPPNFGSRPGEPGFIGKFRDAMQAHVHQWSERAWRYYLWSYYRNVEQFDHSIGRLLDMLDRYDLAEQTLVIFISDHGEGCAHHGLQLKTMLYDEHLRVPAIIRYPGHVRPGTVSPALASGLDLLPTCCDYAGAGVPEGCSGISLRNLLETGVEPERTAIFAEAARTTAWMVRTRRFKYVEADGDPAVQLFDLQADPGERVNLAADPAHAGTVAEHRRLLGGRRKTLDLR